MPIKGLSTREDTTARFKVIGKLRKGEPKQSNGQMGADLADYFRFTSDDPEIVRTFYGIYGDKPNHIDFYLPFDHEEANFSSWRELYGTNGLVKRRCDGEHWQNWIDGMRYMRGQKLCELECKDTPNRCPGCPMTSIGRLSIILEPMWRAGYIGLITVLTSGINDIGEISSRLVQHEPLAGKEFELYRETRKIGAPNKKTNKRMAVSKSLVFVELTQRWMLNEIEAAKRTAQARLTGNVPALPSTIDTGIDFSAVAGLNKPDEPLYVEPDEAEEIEGVIIAPEDGTDYDGNGMLEYEPEPTPEPESTYIRVPYPGGLSGQEMLAHAVTVMSFKNVGECMTVLAQVLGPDWRKSEPAAQWETLDAHCASATVQAEMPLEVPA